MQIPRAVIFDSWMLLSVEVSLPLTIPVHIMTKRNVIAHIIVYPANKVVQII